MKRVYALPLAAAAILITYLCHQPTPTTLVLKIGQTFEEVENASTFPVRKTSNLPANDNDGFGTTWVTEPAVVVRFSDPVHGFTLPPTRFAAIGYLQNKVLTISTTPMLYKMPFDQGIAELGKLQHQFQAGGWLPRHYTNWFDLSPAGQQKLRKYVRDENHGYMKTAFLIVPGKYEMIFRFYCAEHCDSDLGLDRYLIDIGVGDESVKRE